jgi:dihydrofolate reductase
MGSGELIQTLMRHDLIDEFLLMIHPLVLCSGRRLFAEDSPPAHLRLVDSKPTTQGVLIATYQAAVWPCDGTGEEARREQADLLGDRVVGRLYRGC